MLRGLLLMWMLGCGSPMGSMPELEPQFAELALPAHGTSVKKAEPEMLVLVYPEEKAPSQGEAVKMYKTALEAAGFVTLEPRGQGRFVLIEGVKGPQMVEVFVVKNKGTIEIHVKLKQG